MCSSGGCTSMLLLRPLDGSRVHAYGFVCVSELPSFILLKLLSETWSRMAQWATNRPGISMLRAMDQEFYTVLTAGDPSEKKLLINNNSRHSFDPINRYYRRQPSEKARRSCPVGT